MAIWTVHEPPARGRGSLDHAERIEFVRDGLSWPALLFPLPWMLVKRLWLVAALYVAGLIVLNVVLILAGQSELATVLDLAISVIVGLEAANLRRWTLERRGFRLVAVLSEQSLTDAERRFFASWRPASGRQPASVIGDPSTVGA
jgi:hypothetical protein